MLFVGLQFFNMATTWNFEVMCDQFNLHTMYFYTQSFAEHGSKIKLQLSF